jgi:hypothetical protein
MNTSEIEILSVSGQAWKYPLEKTQFSIAGEWDNEGWLLKVKHLFYFQGEGPHEIGTPLEKLGPLFSFNRSVSPDEIKEKGLIVSLQMADSKFASNEIPFPAGISFGSRHWAVREMSCSITWLSFLEFRCRVNGTLRSIQDDPRGLDEATFGLAIQTPFDGIWLESNHPEDRAKIDSFYDALFGTLDFTKEFDVFTDGIVLRAIRTF